MLTAKGIGGGGAAEVTNGILQEMYAAEGEIPANTFVEVREGLGAPESAESFESLGVSELDSTNSSTHHLKINKIDLLLYISIPTSSSSGVTVNIQYRKLDGYSYIRMPSISISGPNASYNGSYDASSGSKYFDPIILGQNRILFIDYVSYYKNSSLVTSVNLMYFIAEWSDDGTLSIPEGSALKFLEIFTLNSPNYISIREMHSYKIDASTIGCFVPYTITNRNSSGTTTGLDFRVNAIKLSLSSDGTLSKIKHLYKQSTASSSLTSYSQIARISNIVSIQHYLLVGFALFGKTNTKSNFSVLVVDKDSWDAVNVLKEGTSELIFTSDYIPQLCSVDDCLVVFNVMTNKTLTVSAYGLELNSSGKTATLLNALPNVQNNHPDGEVYPGCDGEILNNHMFMINAYKTSSPRKRTLKVLQFKDGKLSEITDWFNAPDIIPDNNSNFCIFQAIDDLILILDYDYVYVCKFGTFYPFAHLPETVFNGLTKTKCTETQKGQVWMLNTQEGE